MSETHVRNAKKRSNKKNKKDADLVSLTNSSLNNKIAQEPQQEVKIEEEVAKKKEEENNNVNKTTTTTSTTAATTLNKNSNHNNDDEVIEQFDFSDSDLNALNENEENNTDDVIVDEVNATRAGSAAAVTAEIIAIVDNKDSHSHANETTKDSPNTQKSITNLSQVAESTIDDNTAATDSSINSQPTNAAVTVEATDKRKNIPSNLELKQNEDVEITEATTLATDSYCPITPRCIVDVTDDSDDATDFKMPQRSNLSKTQSSSKIVDKAQSTMTAGNAKASAADSAAGASGSTHDGDDDYYDDEEDEPDDELIVQFLGEANRIAEARLAARRQARAEAREIRMRELERQQKEQEQNADRVFDMHTASGIDPLSRSRLTAGIGVSSPVSGVLLNSVRGSSMSSRRSSEDSLEEEGRSLRDIRHELKDVEERFRKAMIANAQLDNERASQTYQIQLLKDKLEEMEESYAQLQREYKEKSRDCNALKRNLDKLNEELKLVQGQLSERDALIAEQGLLIVAVENEDGTDAKRALVSVENAQLLGSVQGSLDVRLKKFSEEKQQLMAEVQKLQDQLENHKSQGKGRGNSMNGPTGSDEDYEAQREANKIISDYKYKLQKAEQEIASLQASLARSETQVIRYKSTAEAAEKAEAELKIERRKLQRENREAMERLEELETSNNHLLKRLDKLKNAKSALLKDL